MFEILPENTEGRGAVLFSLETTPGHNVAVAGSFNDWDPAAAPMKYFPAERIYKIAIRLEPGECC